MKQIIPIKFWPPVVLLLSSVTLSLVNKEVFLRITNDANSWILTHFSGLFSWSVLGFVLLCVTLYVSPFGKTVIGGSEAQPLLSRWKWFAITLCTSIATGILFWGTAEPLFHFHQLPEKLHLKPMSADAGVFSLATMMLHWTISPYAVYTLTAVVFAYSFYNLKRPFEVGATLYPLLGRRSAGIIGHGVDIICLYGLVAGMAASLGAGILTISGGLQSVLGIASGEVLLAVIALLIVASFVISASTGLMKGIRVLSDYNAKAFICMAFFILLFGPTREIFDLGLRGIADFLLHFFPRSVNWHNALGHSWFQSWTVFNWANWLAWAPVTALFLGRLGRGYSIREFIHMNLFFPSLFGALWMMIFSGASLHFDAQTNGELYQILKKSGPENVIYHILGLLPLAEIVIPVFLLITFLSFVTAADSNTSAMSNLCTKGITTENQESPLPIKIIWGVIIGALAWVMITQSGIEGIKMISVLGGFPALFLVICIALGTIRLLIRQKS